MKNNNGFTLIELLAVIIILALIALISTPVVLNVINSSKEGAAKDSAWGAIDAVRVNYTESVNDPNFVAGEAVVYDFAQSTGENVKMSGTKPKSGTITVDKDGNITCCQLNVSGYYCNTQNNGTDMSCTKKAEKIDDCTK